MGHPAPVRSCLSTQSSVTSSGDANPSLTARDAAASANGRMHTMRRPADGPRRAIRAAVSSLCLGYHHSRSGCPGASHSPGCDVCRERGADQVLQGCRSRSAVAGDEQEGWLVPAQADGPVRLVVRVLAGQALESQVVTIGPLPGRALEQPLRRQPGLRAATGPHALAPASDDGVVHPTQVPRAHARVGAGDRRLVPDAVPEGVGDRLCVGFHDCLSPDDGTVHDPSPPAARRQSGMSVR